MAITGLSTADKAVLNGDLQKEVQRKMFFSRFTGKAVPRTIDEKWTLSGSPINTYDFKPTGRKKMEVPVLGDMGGYGFSGKKTAAGNEEEISLFWQSIFINLKRGALRLPDIVDQETIDMFAAYKDYEELLSNWWAYYENHDVARAYYEGYSKHITDAEADGGLGQAKLLNPNMLNYGGAEAERDFTANAPTFSYTTDDYMSSIIDTWQAMTTDDDFDHYTLNALEAELPNLNIQGWDVGGCEIYPLILHPLQVASLENDAVWTDAQGRAGGKGMDNPIFNGNIGTWGPFVLFSNALAARIPYFQDVTGHTINWFDYTGVATVATENSANNQYKKAQRLGATYMLICSAILMGKNSMNKGIFSGIEYKRRNEEDYGMVTGIGAQQFYGYARNDAYNTFQGDSQSTAKLDAQSAIVNTYQYGS